MTIKTHYHHALTDQCISTVHLLIPSLIYGIKSVDGARDDEISTQRPLWSVKLSAKQRSRPNTSQCLYNWKDLYFYIQLNSLTIEVKSEAEWLRLTVVCGSGMLPLLTPALLIQPLECRWAVADEGIIPFMSPIPVTGPAWLLMTWMTSSNPSSILLCSHQSLIDEPINQSNEPNDYH